MTDITMLRVIIPSLLEDILKLVPKSKVPAARRLVDEFLELHMSGRQYPAWTEERKAKASATWRSKRNAKTYYLYDGKSERIVVGTDEACEVLGVTNSYLACKLSTGGGVAFFKRKVLVSKSKIVDHITAVFIAKNGRTPEHHELPRENAY